MGTNRAADIVIVGAGVAGLALALRLGRLGRQVLVLERAAAPRDKVCGEGLMPLGLAALERLGFPREALPGRDFRGMAYSAGSRSGRLRFPPGVAGRGLRRTALLGLLERALADCPTVTLAREQVLGPLMEGGRVVGVRGREGHHAANTVVAADGVNGRLAAQAGIGVSQRGYRMGLRRHYRVPAWRAGPWVRVGLFHPFDLFLTPVGDGTLLATTMTTREGYRRIVGDYDGFLRETPFGPLFREAEPAGEPMAWYHPLRRAERHHRPGLLVVGDAGGGLDPCLGLGISLALVTAELAAQALEPGTAAAAGFPFQGAPRAAGPLAGYEASCRALFEHYRLFDTIFRLTNGSPRGAEWLVAGMNLWPRLAARICGIVAQGHPWREILGRGSRRAVFAAGAVPFAGPRGKKGR